MKKIIFFPLITKIVPLIIDLNFMYLIIFNLDQYPGISKKLTLSIGMLLLLLGVYFLIFVVALLKTDINGVYIFRACKWELLGPISMDKIQVVKNGVKIYSKKKNLFGYLIIPNIGQNNELKNIILEKMGTATNVGWPTHSS